MVLAVITTQNMAENTNQKSNIYCPVIILLNATGGVWYGIV